MDLELIELDAIEAPMSTDEGIAILIAAAWIGLYVGAVT